MDIQSHASQLRSALDAVGGPASDSTVDFAIATSLGVGYLARNRSGAPTFLVPLSISPSSVGRRGGGFALRPVPRVAFNYRERRWEQAAASLECTEAELLDTFLVLVLDLAKRLETARIDAYWRTILVWVEEWQTLLGRRTALTPEQQLGLWGELWMVSKAAEPDLLIAAWRGPDRDAIDFFLDGIGLEIKVSRSAHVHHVSQKQVQLPVGVHEAYLLSLWVAPEPSRGLALPDLVDSLIRRVTDPAAVLKQIALVGYCPQDRELYGTRYALLEPPLWFRAADVPRVRTVDSGISHIRYQVALDPEKCLEDGSYRHLWRHFCQVEPSFSTPSNGVS